MNNIRELSKQAGIFKLGKTVKQIKSIEEGKIMTLMKKHFSRFWRTSLLDRVHQEIGDENDLIVCVEPNAFWTHDESIAMLLESTKFEVYSFDGQHKKSKLNMQIPSWIVKNTFDQLAEKRKLEEELNFSLRENIKVFQREYDSIYGETAAETSGRRYSKPNPLSKKSFSLEKDYKEVSSSFDEFHQFPLIDYPFFEQLDEGVSAMGDLIDKNAKYIPPKKQEAIRKKWIEFEKEVRSIKDEDEVVNSESISVPTSERKESKDVSHI